VIEKQRRILKIIMWFYSLKLGAKMGCEVNGEWITYTSCKKCCNQAIAFIK
jgi:hypothetical protein